MKVISATISFALLALTLLTTGCVAVVVGAAAGAGAAGYAYVSGELKSTESATLAETYKASLAAMKDLEFPVISQTKDALEAQVTARNSSDKKIVVKLTKASGTATEVRIRVGTFGDESISRLILEKIKKHL